MSTHIAEVGAKGYAPIAQVGSVSTFATWAMSAEQYLSVWVPIFVGLFSLVLTIMAIREKLMLAKINKLTLQKLQNETSNLNKCSSDNDLMR